MPDQSPTVLDHAHLDRVTGGDRSLVGELLGMLGKELDERERQLDTALEAEDTELAIEAAHKLQGAAAYTGAARLGHAAAALEARLREGEDCASDLDTLRAAIGELRRRLRADQSSSSST